MNRNPQVEGLQTAAAGVIVGKLSPDLVEYIVVSRDRLADDKGFCRFQRLPDAFAAGDFTNASMAGIILQNNDIAGKKRTMRPAEVKQHTVKAGDWNDGHLGDFRRTARREIVQLRIHNIAPLTKSFVFYFSSQPIDPANRRHHHFRSDRKRHARHGGRIG